MQSFSKSRYQLQTKTKGKIDPQIGLSRFNEIQTVRRILWFKEWCRQIPCKYNPNPAPKCSRIKIQHKSRQIPVPTFWQSFKLKERRQQPGIKSAERQLYRITVEYRNLNRATLNDTTSIELDKESKQYFNFFMQNEIWTNNVLAQSWSGSPKISRDAIEETFSVKMLNKFLILKKIKDFPFTHYGQFLSSF